MKTVIGNWLLPLQPARRNIPGKDRDACHGAPMSGNEDSVGTAAVASKEDARIAAIDIGSKSVRLVVAQVLPGEGYRILNEERENTRLTSILASTGRLDTTAGPLRIFHL